MRAQSLPRWRLTLPAVTRRKAGRLWYPFARRLRVVRRLLSLEGGGRGCGGALEGVVGGRRQEDVEAKLLAGAGGEGSVAGVGASRRVADDIDACGTAEVACGIDDRAIGVKAGVGTGGDAGLDGEIELGGQGVFGGGDRRSTRLNSSPGYNSY